jgi:hypothetical protein
MKTILKISTIVLTIGALAWACEDIQTVSPIVNTSASTLSANFLFVNASPDAPALNLYVNNNKVVSSVGTGGSSGAYLNVPITLNGVTSNTAIRVLGPHDSIGGTLKKNYLIFRAGNTNTNNFQATDGGYYTLIVVDTINRKSPARTNNSLGVGDITYYSTVDKFVSDTTINLTVGYNSIVTANLIKKHNSGSLPFTFFPIGTVPLGSTDAGGPRFLLVTDNLTLPATSPLFPSTGAGKISVRFINASPDAELGSVTVPPISCSINGTVNTNLIPTANGAFSYPMFRVTGSFDPAVGSRAASGSNPFTVAFKTDFASTGASYPVSVYINGNSTPAVTSSFDFSVSGAYTVILTGLVAKNNLALTVVKNK